MTSRPFRREDVTFFESRAALRSWFEANHDRAEVLQVGYFKKASGKATFSYEDAVEEALCFGWIDGVRHAIDDETFTQRFTPRKARSNWSEINIRRVEALIEQGLMHEAGLQRFRERETAPAPYSYQQSDGLGEPYRSRMQADEDAWSFFSKQAPWYQRTAGFWVMSAKQEATRERRFAILLADSKAGRRLAQLSRPAAERGRERTGG